MASLFKTMSPENARLRTLWSRHARDLGFRACGCGWMLSAALTPQKAQYLALYGVFGGSEFTLWLGDPDWRVLAGAVLEIPADAVAELPESLIRAAIECFADDALAGLEKALAMPLALTRLEQEASRPPTAALSFRLDCESGPGASGAWVVAERDSSWRAAVEKALSALPVRNPGLPGALPLEGAVIMGVWTMAAAELAELERGDVALSPPGGRVFLTVGRKLRFDARFDKGMLVVEGNSMATTPPALLSDESLAPIGEAEVEVQAQVGRVTVTLAQLRLLGEGQVVEFTTPVESPASLIVGGRLVATGELVDVGGRVGVRITRMAER